MIQEKSILEMLQEKLDEIPLMLRGSVRIGFKLDEVSLDKSLETKYQIATSRLRHLDYFLMWSYGVHQKDTLYPPETEPFEVKGVPCSFNDFDEMGSSDLSLLNSSFSKWINNHLVRDLDEFLQYYLLSIYETCLIAEYVGQAITPRDIITAKESAKKFEASSLQERLKVLRRNYKIDVTHKSEIYSLNKIRQIFAHFDGVVQKKFCDDNGVLKVKWPTNSIKLKHRKTGKLVPFEKASQPFNVEYGAAQIKWLSDPKEAEYKVNDCIELTHSDLNQLIFFYLYVFNELQENLVNYILQKGVNVRGFETYSLSPTVVFSSKDHEDDGDELSSQSL
ncbi:MAG: hypothetical protein VX196_06900 [Pseudomonadota bacterium]|jgi:hypothetical protein|nr:hypothetical protein [Pseudomonadota bacterium]